MGLLVGLMDKMGLLMLRSEQAQPPRGERGYQPMGPPRSFESCNFVNHSFDSFDNSSDILETKWKEADVYQPCVQNQTTPIQTTLQTNHSLHHHNLPTATLTTLNT
jgi:hypothetical protein